AKAEMEGQAAIPPQPFDPSRHRQRLGLGVANEIDVQDDADDRKVEDLLDDEKDVVHAFAGGEVIEDEAGDKEQQVPLQKVAGGEAQALPPGWRRVVDRVARVNFGGIDDDLRHGSPP